MAAWSERRLIEKIQKASSGSKRGLLKSIGDDCCEVVASGSFLISTDSLVDGIHFNRLFHPAHLLGRKSVAVNLSDIAAMGGRPRFILLSLCLPVDIQWEWISNWLDGVLEILDEYDCVLIGGDTVQAKELVLTVTVLGEPLETGAIYRNTAEVGDTVWVSGPLGSAGCGLKLLMEQLETGKKITSKGADILLAAHLNPRPQIELGLQLAGSGMVTAMQDISDGIATDLAHICKASEVSATILEASLPFSPELIPAAAKLETAREDFILRAGEDYQLVFTVKHGAETDFRNRLEGYADTLVKIGEIRSGKGLFLQKDDGTTKEISFQGYEH